MSHSETWLLKSSLCDSAMRRLKAKSSLILGEVCVGYHLKRLFFFSLFFLFREKNFFKLEITEREPGMQYFLTGLLPELSQTGV